MAPQILFVLYPFAWLLGLGLPLVYIYAFSNLRCLSRFVLDKYLVLPVFLLLCLLLSTAFSPLYDHFSLSRFVAMAHNLSVLFLVIVGFCVFKKYHARYEISYVGWLYWFGIAFVLIGVAVYVLKDTHQPVAYGGVFDFLGLGFDSVSKFTTVSFNFADYYLGVSFPRNTVYSIYPNATGLTFFLIHFIYVYFSKNEKEKLSFFLLFFVEFMTGSRFFALLAFLLLLLRFVNSRKILLLAAAVLPVFVVIMIPVIFVLISAREGSNIARWIIYTKSIGYMLDVNPVFGLGMKPILPDVLGLPYPVGSHSTILGLFVRGGIVAGMIGVMCYFLVYLRGAVYILGLLSGKICFARKRFCLEIYFCFIVSATIFEDVDVIGFIGFLFGACLYIYKIINPVPCPLEFKG